MVDIEKLISRYRCIKTRVGYIFIMPFQSQYNNELRPLVQAEVHEFYEELKDILDDYSIVAFQHGKLDGRNYGYKISGSYGSECGQIFMVLEQ